MLDWCADEMAEWLNAPMAQRLLTMGVCVPSLLNENVMPDIGEAHAVVAAEGLCEGYHVLPYEGPLGKQPQGLVEAFSIIRRTRNEEQVRSIQEQRAEMNRMKWSGGGGG